MGRLSRPGVVVARGSTPASMCGSAGTASILRLRRVTVTIGYMNPSSSPSSLLSVLCPCVISCFSSCTLCMLMLQTETSSGSFLSNEKHFPCVGIYIVGLCSDQPSPVPTLCLNELFNLGKPIREGAG
eukprot:c17394_g1_i1 orf=266-649(-)